MEIIHEETLCQKCYTMKRNYVQINHVSSLDDPPVVIDICLQCLVEKAFYYEENGSILFNHPRQINEQRRFSKRDNRS